MNYTHLTTGERHKIELLLQQGKTARAIGRILNRYHSTYPEKSREIQQQDIILISQKDSIKLIRTIVAEKANSMKIL
jgi:IS30 family transposase